MKAVDALNLLDQAVAQIHGSRQAHVQLGQAIGCLRDLVDDAGRVVKAPAKEKEQPQA